MPRNPPNLTSRRTVMAGLVAASCLAAFGSALAQPYQSLGAPGPSVSGQTSEVVEFFSYGCPHCSTFEPHFAAWKSRAPKDVAVVRVPVEFSAAWKPLARLYYGLLAIKAPDAAHADVFAAIHTRKINFDQEAARKQWASRQGLDPAKLEDAMKSFGVESQLQRARKLTQDYAIASVPTVAVNGRYTVTVQSAGGENKVGAVLDQLLAQAPAAGKSAASPGR